MKHSLVALVLFLPLAIMALAKCPLPAPLQDNSQILQFPISHDIDFTGSPVGAIEEVLRGSGIPGGLSNSFPRVLLSPASASRCHAEQRFETQWMP
jgi:hypothetical protein